MAFCLKRPEISFFFDGKGFDICSCYKIRLATDEYMGFDLIEGFEFSLELPKYLYDLWGNNVHRFQLMIQPDDGNFILDLEGDKIFKFHVVLIKARTRRV